MVRRQVILWKFISSSVWLNKVLYLGDFGNSKRCDRRFRRCGSQWWCPAADVQIRHRWHRFVDITQKDRSLERPTNETDKHRIHKLWVTHQSVAIPHPAHVPGTGNCCALSEQGPRKWGTLVNLKKINFNGRCWSDKSYNGVYIVQYKLVGTLMGKPNALISSVEMHT